MSLQKNKDAKPEPLPRLTQALREGEIAELRSGCTTVHQPDPETGKRPDCPITQGTHELRPDLHQILTSCAACERRRHCDADPREAPTAGTIEAEDSGR